MFKTIVFNFLGANACRTWLEKPLIKKRNQLTNLTAFENIGWGLRTQFGTVKVFLFTDLKPFFAYGYRRAKHPEHTHT